MPEQASARRRYCCPRCAARARQRRRRQRFQEAPDQSAPAQLRAELVEERARSNRVTAALHQERSYSNRLEAQLAQCRGRGDELAGQVATLRSRLRLFDRREGRALIRQANYTAELRDRLTAATTAVATDMTGQTDHPDRSGVTGHSPTERDRGTGHPAVTDHAEVASVRDRLATVTDKYDALAGQYRELFTRYEDLAAGFNEAAVMLRTARQEREAIAVLIGHWNELCRRLATTTRGRSRSQRDREILTAWAQLTRHASQTVTAQDAQEQ